MAQTGICGQVILFSREDILVLHFPTGSAEHTSIAGLCPLAREVLGAERRIQKKMAQSGNQFLRGSSRLVGDCLSNLNWSGIHERISPLVGSKML
jgi:hypothetical protein